MDRIVIISLVFVLFSQSSIAQIGGEPNFIEPGLKNRNDIILYGAFETEDWYSVWNLGFNPKNTSVSPDGFDGKALQVNHEKGLYGGTGGGVLKVYQLSKWPELPAFHDEFYFRYYIRLDPNFPYVKGGKIPGLNAHKAWGGGSHPDGTNGWSARYMWDAAGEIFLYAYLPGESGWGTNLKCDVTGKRAKLLKGKWHCIEQYIKLNAVGEQNGKIYTWFDGNQCQRLENIVFRTADTPENKEIGTSFHNFFGGSGEQWAPPYETYMQFDNVVMATGPIGTRTGEGVLPPPVIETPGGDYDDQVVIKASAPEGSEIRYTTNGDIPGYHSQLYQGPIRLAKSGTVQLRAFSDTKHYSPPAKMDYTISSKVSSTEKKTLDPVGDALIRHGKYANENYGSSGTLYLKQDTQDFDRRGLIKFSVKNLDPVEVRSVVLRVFVQNADNGSRISLLESASNWNEEEVTWNSQPAEQDVIGEPKPAVKEQWLEWDVTNYAASQLENGADDLGFGLLSLEGTATLRSRENDDKKPELVVITGTPSPSSLVENKAFFKKEKGGLLHQALEFDANKAFGIKMISSHEVYNANGKVTVQKVK